MLTINQSIKTIHEGEEAAVKITLYLASLIGLIAIVTLF